MMSFSVSQCQTFEILICVDAYSTYLEQGKYVRDFMINEGSMVKFRTV